MKRVPRPNVRKRRGRRWKKRQRARAHSRRLLAEFIDRAITLMGKSTCALLRAMDEHEKRLLAAGAKPSGRSMRIPLRIDIIDPANYRKETT